MKAILSSLIFFISTAQAQAMGVSCEASYLYGDPHVVGGVHETKAAKGNIELTPIPGNPKALMASPIFDFGNNYEVRVRISIQPTIDPSEPVSQFNDYSLWMDIVPDIKEHGHKRALGHGEDKRIGSGAQVGDDLPGDVGCKSTLCAAADTQNVDHLTLRLNGRPDSITLPWNFRVTCDWNK